MHKFLFYNKFIMCLYMFRALLCSSSGSQNCIIQHLVSSHSVGGRPVHRSRDDSTCTPYAPTGALKPDIVFQWNRTRPFKSAGGRQFSRLLAAEVCGISGTNAGYTMFRGSVKGTGYPLHSPVHLNRPVGVSSVDCWQQRCAHQR